MSPPLMNEDAERGWSHLVNDVHGLFRKRDEEPLVNKVAGIPESPAQTTAKESRLNRTFLLEIFIIAVITACGLSVGYFIINFVLKLF